MGGIDVEIGRRLRNLRQSRELTMQQVGEHLGLSYQQVQKYETGANRVSAARLFEFARILEVPISAFFANLQVDTDQPGRNPTPSDRTEKLMREFDRLSDAQRRAVLSLMRSMSDATEPPRQQNGS